MSVPNPNPNSHHHQKPSKSAKHCAVSPAQGFLVKKDSTEVRCRSCAARGWRDVCPLHDAASRFRQLSDSFSPNTTGASFERLKPLCREQHRRKKPEQNAPQQTVRKFPLSTQTTALLHYVCDGILFKEKLTKNLGPQNSHFLPKIFPVAN